MSAGLVSQHQQTSFAVPANGNAGDATVVLGNDNATVTSYNAHDADATIHVQSSTAAVFAATPAGTAGRKWMTNNTGAVYLYYDTGNAWVEANYLRVSAAGQITPTTAIVGAGATAVSTAPLELLSATDAGLSLTSGYTGAAGGAECYVTSFMQNASPTYIKMGSLAWQQTSKDATTGYCSVNAHATALTGGVSADYFAWGFWAKHGMVIFPADLTAGSAPGNGILSVNGAVSIVTSLSVGTSITATAGNITATNGDVVLSTADTWVGASANNSIKFNESTGAVTITSGGSIRIKALNGQLGFYGVTPVSQQALPTGAGKTADNVITALQNLGLVSQT